MRRIRQRPIHCLDCSQRRTPLHPLSVHPCRVKQQQQQSWRQLQQQQQQQQQQLWLRDLVLLKDNKDNKDNEDNYLGW